MSNSSQLPSAVATEEFSDPSGRDYSAAGAHAASADTGSDGAGPTVTAGPDNPADAFAVEPVPSPSDLVTGGTMAGTA